MDPKPTKIFKYVSAEIADIIIEEKKLKFSDPSTFNDAFDCDVDSVDFQLGVSLNHAVVTDLQTLNKKFGHLQAFQRLTQQQNYLERMYRHGAVEKIKGARVCCFSLINDNELMWAHYAAKSTGVCLEFNSNLSETGFIDLSISEIGEGVVVYDSHERLNYLSADRMDLLHRIFFCKKPIWAYEKEFRLITLGNYPDLQKFHLKFLTAVYFGIKFPETKINDFISHCRQNGFNDLKFFRAVKRKSIMEFEEMRSL